MERFARDEFPDGRYGRRRGESDPAWQAYQIYRDMGSQRSLAKVAAQAEKNIRLIARWSSQYGWRDRAWAHDGEMDKVRIQTHKGAVEEMANRHAELAAKMLETAMKRLVHINVDELTPRDLAKLLAVAVGIERYSRGAELIMVPRMPLRPPPDEDEDEDMPDLLWMTEKPLV